LHEAQLWTSFVPPGELMQTDSPSQGDARTGRRWWC
jgi:hypothetical protein